MVKNNDTLCVDKNCEKGCLMTGIAYVNPRDSIVLKQRLEYLDSKQGFYDAFWEDAFFDINNLFSDNIPVYFEFTDKNSFFEINTYNDIVVIDYNSESLKSDSIDVICDVFGIDSRKIENVKAMKKGMTNRSFIFEVNNVKYIMRIPGEGTDKLINRREEADVYNEISKYELCDKVIYINPENGFKITEYIENARNCDPGSVDDITRSLTYLRKFHQMKLSVSHTFDIYKYLDFYESLWEDKSSVHPDYKKTKDIVISLKSFIEENVSNYCLTHIDAVCDNFIFTEDESGGEKIKLIDWEYAGMQDPHVDVAMFCIYAMYNRDMIEKVIDIYFENKCEDRIRTKIYCYISVCGLLWSNWCEYKSQLGLNFGEYSMKQYQYAVEYGKIALERIKQH